MDLDGMMEPAIIDQNNSFGRQKEEGWYEGGEEESI